MKIFELPISSHTEVVSVADPQHLANCLKRAVAEELMNALKTKQRASLLVSGGSTPQSFLAQLSEADIPWDRVDVSLADERWISPEDQQSNEGMVRRLLLRNAASQANFISLWSNESAPNDTASTVNERLKSLPMPVDVCVLGMGTDGHTASFFPNAEGLEDSMSDDTDQLCLAVIPPGDVLPRITLTKPVLFGASKVYLHIEGAKKLATLAAAFEAGDEKEMPIRAFLDHPNLAIFWADID